MYKSVISLYYIELPLISLFCYPKRTYEDYPFLALFCYPIRIYLLGRIEKCVHPSKQQVARGNHHTPNSVFVFYTFVIIVRKRLFIIWCKMHLRLCTMACIYSTMIIGRGEALPMFVYFLLVKVNRFIRCLLILYYCFC